MPEATEQTNACPKCGAAAINRGMCDQAWTCDSYVSHGKFRNGYACMEQQLAQQAAAIQRLEGEREALRELIVDDGLFEAARRCYDPDHDDRYCSSCSLRGDGIESYQAKLLAALSAAAQQQEEGK